MAEGMLQRVLGKKKKPAVIDAGTIPIDVRERDRFGEAIPDQSKGQGLIDYVDANYDRFGVKLPKGGAATDKLLADIEARRKKRPALAMLTDRSGK